ncbi:MAG: cation:proton antiporter [Pyrinomonadaceae bacterium]|jgi:CPA2 family monovalent cation:H+ antiporter-2
MHTPQLFQDLLIILLVSVPVAYLCLRLKLPLLVGFMLSGMAIGPYGLGLIRELEGIEVLAEIGVTLLLFTIGLEFSLARLREMKRLVFIGGSLQVIFTTIAVAALATGIGRPPGQSVFFGFLVAMSSTAIVLKSYVDRNEVDAPHGRAGIAILLFQDILVVFMLLAVPLLGGKSSAGLTGAFWSLATSLLALVTIVFGAWLLLPRFLDKMAVFRSPELFILTVALFVVGMSWMTSHFGLSFALGGFIAGMVLSETDYCHQAMTEVLPFRDVFNSLFYVSIGLLLSLSALWQNIGLVAGFVLMIIVGKAVIIWLVIRLLGYPQRIAAMAALGLAQIGEFSFVLARSGLQEGLFFESDYQLFLASAIVSMTAAPFLINLAPRFGYFAQTVLNDGSASDFGNVEDDEIHLTSSGGLQQHVIIVGYGLNGRNLARVLRAVGIPYLVLELNAEVVRRAKAMGEKINYGDATRREVLLHAGIEKAWSLVLAMSDPDAARRTVRQARILNDSVHIIVRTRYVAEITELYALGANEVIPEEFETSIEIFSRVLQRYGVARNVIEGQIERIRRQGYELLRKTGAPPAQLPEINVALDAAATETIQIEENSPAIGRNLAELDVRGKTGATVIAAVRNNKMEISPGADFRVEKGDKLVLIGTPPGLEKAIEMLSPGEIASTGFNP